MTAAVGALVVFVVGGCTGTGPAAMPSASGPATPPTAAAGSQRISVSLWHCGIDPVVVDGQKWEVSRPPFDATNAPKGWVGKGWAVVESPQSLVYGDESGISLRFTPDDGVPPPPCA